MHIGGPLSGNDISYGRYILGNSNIFRQQERCFSVFINFTLLTVDFGQKVSMRVFQKYAHAFTGSDLKKELFYPVFYYLKNYLPYIRELEGMLECLYLFF